MRRGISMLLVLLLLVSSLPATGFASAETTSVTGPVPDRILLIGYSDKTAALNDVASGKVDFAYLQYSKHQIPASYLENVSLIQETDQYFDILFNPVHDRGNPYLITLQDGTKKFNPFAIREVRFAINWLINREYVVQDLEKGSGVEKFTPFYELAPYYPQELKRVVDILGITKEGNEIKALNMINDAMEGASQELAKEGYELKRIDGKWYFEGEPIKLVGIIRIEDERKDIGNYLADLLEKAGFTVERKEVDRATAGGIVYNTLPEDYRWNFYTEGWGGGSLEELPVWRLWIYSGRFWAPSSTGWKWTRDNIERITVGNILKKIGGGNIASGISALDLKYYTTPEKISPILDWTVDEIDNALEHYRFNSTEQAWDLNRLGLALGLYESFRVYVSTRLYFYLANKNTLKSYTTSPLFGLYGPSFITAETNDGEVKVAMLRTVNAPYGDSALLPGSINPSSWSALSRTTFRPLILGGTKCIVSSIEYNASPANSPVIWNDFENRWVPANFPIAPVKVTITCNLGVWHDNESMTLADYIAGIAFDFEISFKEDGLSNYPEDKYLASQLKNILGFEFNDLENGSIQIVEYQKQIVDKNAPSGMQVAYFPSPTAPWQIYEAVLNLIQREPYNEHKLDWEGINLLNSTHANDIKAELQRLMENETVPRYLEGYVRPEDVKKRYEASIKFIEEHGHAFIGDGPFYIEYYNVSKAEMLLVAFRNPRFPYTPHDYIEMYNTDTTPPVITIDISNTTVNVGNTTVINFAVSDDHDIKYVGMTITLPNGSTITESFNPEKGAYSYEYTVNDVGTYKVTIRAEDEFGNVNTMSKEFYGQKVISETITVSEEDSNVTAVSDEDVELNVDVNQSAVSGETELTVNVTITSNEGELKEDVASLAVAQVVTNESNEEETTQAVAPIKYVKVDVQTSQNTQESIVEKYTLKIKYNEEELGGIDENTLSLYYWNGSAWIRVTDYIGKDIPSGPHVYDAGVNTEENYVWAVVNHFSVYALGGSSKPEVNILTPTEGEHFKASELVNVKVKWNGKDKLGIDHYEIKLNNGPWITLGTTTEYILRDLPGGKYTVYVKAVNVLGTTTVDSVRFEVTIYKARTTKKSRANIVIVFWVMYRYQKLRFDELYNQAVASGIDNETLQKALSYANAAEEYYQKANTYGTLPTEIVPYQIAPLRLAFLNMKRAVDILAEALKKTASL